MINEEFITKDMPAGLTEKVKITRQNLVGEIDDSRQRGDEDLATTVKEVVVNTLVPGSLFARSSSQVENNGRLWRIQICFGRNAHPLLARVEEFAGEV